MIDGPSATYGTADLMFLSVLRSTSPVMKPERWQQVDNLFHLALERKPMERDALLEQACAGDDALRKEVEALLAAHEAAGSFIEKPAVEIEARSIANAQGEAQPMVGKTIDHYRLVALLGRGGMGEVYLAEDTVLGRKVALKLLPSLLIKDTARLRRFEQEARAASALNHPNIVTIHEIGRGGDFHFIAQEFVEGVTLTSHLGRQPLALNKTLEVTMQVASALSAAHAKGIVHRDIKPENIMLQQESHLGRQDHVKVLDFGIAKLAEVPGMAMQGEATTRLLLRTEEGTAIGTAAYMSPEQARGESVDARTDIWSLGVVLYEMLTGKQPFAGDTSQDVIAAILRDDLPQLPSEAPETLKWILKKALRKDREDRYQTAREFFSDLRDLHTQLSEIQSNAGRPVPRVAKQMQDGQTGAAQEQRVTTRLTSSVEFIQGEVKRRGVVAIVGLAALILALAGITFGLYKLIGQKQTQISQGPTKPAIPFQSMKIARLTSTGKAAVAAISPDGKFVVHVVDDAGQQSLWMRQVSTSSNVQVNPPADIDYLGLTFSRDGNYLYYVAWDKKNPFTLYQMAVLGGTSRKLIADIDSNVTFSPDGKQFAFVRGSPAEGKVLLLVANADGTAERTIATRPIAPGTFGDPAWSPDGRTIIYPAESIDANGWTLEQVQVENGSVKPISPQRWWEPDYLKWLPDGSGLMFTARESVAGPSQIWYLSYPGGEAHRITHDLNDYIGVSLAADSAVLITIQSEQVSNIWIAPNNNARQAHQITTGKFDGAQGVSWTPDGKIVYASGPSGRWEIWMVDANGLNQKQLIADAGNNHSPSVSPDGRYVFFVSDRTGSNHISRIDIDGSDARQLTNDNGEWNPQCLPTGQSVLYETSKPGIWKVPLDGGQPVEIIASHTSAGIAISPDGKWVATAYFEPAARKTAIYPIEGTQSQKILDIAAINARWTPDGHSLAYIDEKDFSRIVSHPIDNSSPKPLIDFRPDRIFSFAWSRDGKQLALARGTVNTDVVLISNIKDQQ